VREEEDDMLRISCRDIDIEGCDFVAEGTKIRKLESSFFDHLRAEHPEVIAGLAGDDYRKLEHRIREAMMTAAVHGSS
jgi:predicted small metal-binding protein